MVCGRPIEGDQPLDSKLERNRQDEGANIMLGQCRPNSKYKKTRPAAFQIVQ